MEFRRRYVEISCRRICCIGTNRDIFKRHLLFNFNWRAAGAPQGIFSPAASPNTYGTNVARKNRTEVSRFSCSVSKFWDFFFEDTCNGNTGYLNALAHCTQYIQLPSNFPLTFSHSCFTIGEQPRGHWLEPLSRTAVRSSLRLYVSDETGHQFF